MVHKIVLGQECRVRFASKEAVRSPFHEKVPCREIGTERVAIADVLVVESSLCARRMYFLERESRSKKQRQNHFDVPLASDPYCVGGQSVENTRKLR